VPAEPGIGDQTRNQQVVPARDIEVRGGRNLAQVADRGVEGRGRRLAGINVKGAVREIDFRISHLKRSVVMR